TGARDAAVTSTFGGYRIARCFFARLIDLLFHLKAREPLGIAWHVSGRIHAALPGCRRKILPVLDNLITGFLFGIHATLEILLSLGAKYRNEGFFRCPASCRDVGGWHLIWRSTRNARSCQAQTEQTCRQKLSPACPCRHWVSSRYAYL